MTFKTQDEVNTMSAQQYDDWLRSEVESSIADNSPLTANEVVMERIRGIIADKAQPAVGL